MMMFYFHFRVTWEYSIYTGFCGDIIVGGDWSGGRGAHCDCIDATQTTCSMDSPVVQCPVITTDGNNIYVTVAVYHRHFTFL